MAVWTTVIVLTLFGFIASAGRTFSVLEDLGSPAGERPELSSLDRNSTRQMTVLIGAKPGSEEFRELDEQNRRFLGKFYQHPVATLLHVLPAALFLILAPLQFSRTIRTRHIRWHRWAGRVLMVIAIPIGLSGLFFGLLFPFSGTIEASAIAIFGALFLIAPIQGFRAIRKGEIARHREWMIRMCAVALGVSTVRLCGIVLALTTREGPEAWFGYSVWLGFTITVCVAEIWIRHTRGVPESARPAGSSVAFSEGT